MGVAVQSVACLANTWKCFATEDSKIEATLEIHAKVLRSSATQATCAQALVIWHSASLAQFSLRCYQRVERCQWAQRSPEEQTEHTTEVRTFKTATIISTQLAPSANRNIAFAAARCARHTLHRVTRSRCAHRAIVSVCPTHSFASRSSQQTFCPQPSVCCRPRCVALNIVTSSLYKLT